MTDFSDVFAGLADWAPQLPCESPGHTAGTEGCSAGSATYIVDLLHPYNEAAPHPKDGPPTRRVVCTGHAAWLRNRLNDTAVCVPCGIRGTFDDWITLTPISNPGPNN